MCPAPRKSRNRGLAPNLHTHPKGFRWKHPRTGKYYYFGKGASEDEANSAARTLNLKYAPKNSIFDKVAVAESESLRSVIAIHRKEYLPAQRVCENTRKNRGYILGKISQSDLASCDVSTITTRDVVQYLKSLASDSLRQQYRAQLLAVFKTAIQEGLIEVNPVVQTSAPHVERERDRLGVEGYAAVHELAEPWLRNLMGLIRYTLQRPEDVLSLRWDAYTGTHLNLTQGKTGAKLAHCAP